MKKTYLKPQMILVEAISEGMIAASGEFGGLVREGSADARGQRNDWDNIWK